MKRSASARLRNQKIRSPARTSRIRVGSGGIVRLYTGRASTYPSVEEAEAYPYTPQELGIVHHARRRSVIGAPEQVQERLTAMAAEHGADELVIVTITRDPKARLRSYELLARTFALDRRDEP